MIFLLEISVRYKYTGFPDENVLVKSTLNHTFCTAVCTPFSKRTETWSFIFPGSGISSLQCQFSSYLSTGLPVASDASDQWEIVDVHFKIVYFHLSCNQDAIPTVYKLEICMPNVQRKLQSSERLKRLKINILPKIGRK